MYFCRILYDGQEFKQYCKQYNSLSLVKLASSLSACPDRHILQ